MARRISSPILIGREAESRAFELALQDAQGGRPALIVMGGEAGAGKSRLVAEWAARTRSLGGAAVVGAAPPPSGDERTPFAALTQVLRALLRSVDARQLDALLGSARVDLAALLPELGPAPALLESASPFAAARLAESVIVALEALASRRPPLLLALEDLHWADDATRGVVAYACRNLVDVPVVTVVTYRSDASHADRALMAFLAELDRFPDMEHLELEPLSADDVGRQVRSIMGGDPEAEVVAALVRRSNGNPFFVEELLSAIVEGGVDRPPPSVRTMVESRLMRLDAAARELVVVVAVAGADVPVELVARVARMDTAHLDEALREARDAHLIVTSLSGAGGTSGDRAAMTGESAASADRRDVERLDLRHVLVREVIVGGVAAPRRRELHAALASAIEADPALGGSSEIERASRLAGHLLLADQPVAAARALLREAAAAEAARSFDVADHAYRRALRSWPRTADGEGALAEGTGEARERSASPERNATPGRRALPERGAVLERAAQAASLAGDPVSAVALAEEALSLAVPTDSSGQDPDRVVRIRMHLGRFLAEAGRSDEALTQLRQALDAAPTGSSLACRSGLALARQLVAVRRFDEAVRVASAAAAAADRRADRREGAQARSVEAVALARQGRVTEAVAAVRAGDPQAVAPDRSATATRLSRQMEAVEGFLDEADVLEQSGDPAAAARAALRGREDARRRGLSGPVDALLAAVAARDLLLTGAWDEAAGLVEGPLRRGEEEVPQRRLVRALLTSWRGDWVAAEADLAGRRSPTWWSSHGWAAFGDLVEAEHACWRRRYGEARAAVARGVVSAEADGDRTNLRALTLLGIRVEADAAAASTRRNRVDAVSSDELATSHWLRLRTACEASSGEAAPDHRAIATLATAVSEIDRLAGRAEPARWLDAARAWDEAGDPFAAACARWRTAECLLALGGDRTEAREILRHALRSADALLAAPLAREIEQLARRARLADVRDQPRSPLGPSPPGHAEARRLGLSDREIEVLLLIAEGLPDREIADRLFISTKTTGHHVSHILVKLGVERRGQAAAVAHEVGLQVPRG